MSFTEDVFNKKGILKIALISISILIWNFFYFSSQASLKAFINIDLVKIVNSFITFDFLLFILLFPITTAIIIAFSANKDKYADLLEVFSGLALGFIFSLIFFKITSAYMLFFLFYVIAHLILSLITNSKFKDDTKFTTLSNYASSKISLLLTLAFFILIILLVSPHQQEYSNNFKYGLINLFVSDDISNWVGTSYDIGKQSTKASLDYIMESQAYENLLEVDHAKVDNFENFMLQLNQKMSSKTTPKDIEEAYPNLDSNKLKSQIMQTFNDVPLMVVFDKYFALFIAIIFASVLQLYFSLSFSLIGLLYNYIFFKLFVDK